jgi:hypothetical protein
LVTCRSEQAAIVAVDDLGVIEPLRPKPSHLSPYLIGNAGLYYTSNPSLSSSGGRGDLYFVGGGGAGIRPKLTGELYLDGHVSEQVFQYAQFSSLNFSYFNAGGGLDYVFPKLGLTASVRYEYQRFLDGVSYAEFYVNNALTATLQKQFQLNDTMSIQAGWMGAFSLDAQPASSRRQDNNFWLGWNWSITTPLQLQTYYILSIFHYPQDSRTDVTHNVGATLTLAISRWARISAGAGFGANNSTNSFFDYTVVNTGGTLNLDFGF